MVEEDPETGYLYSAEVLRHAKNQCAEVLQVYKDPIIALEILQRNDSKNEIRFLGINPFIVHVSSNYQIKLYKIYCENDDACLIIDATGHIIRKIKRVDGTDSSPIELYELGIHTNVGQFSVALMFSKSHNTNTIQVFLMKLIRFGAPIPEETVSVMAGAILNAFVRAEDSVLNCYIRIDYTHFKKSWAYFLSATSLIERMEL